MPASPLSTTTCPRPSRACAQRSCRSATSASRPTMGVRPRGLTISNRLCASLVPSTRYTCTGVSTPLRGCEPRSSQAKYPCTRRQVASLITTVSGAARPWRRAVILGVSPRPTIPAALVSPWRRPPPVPCGCPGARLTVAPCPLLAAPSAGRWRRGSPAPPARPAGRRPRAPADSRSRPAGHHPGTARCNRQSAGSRRRRQFDRRVRPRDSLPGRAAWRGESSLRGHKRGP